VTHAAESLSISQSGASSAIRALERQYGVQLFNRIGRGIELSQAGTRFLPEAKAVLERAAAARFVLENVSETITGTVSVAASQTIASYWLPNRLAGFHDEHPNVILNVTVGNTQQVEAAVLQGMADIGLVEGRTRSDALRRSTVDTDRLVMVTAPSGNGPPVMIDDDGRLDVRAVRWIVRERGSGTREVLETFVASHEVPFDELQVFLVLPNNEAVRQAVEAGAGATIISERVVADAIAAGKLARVPVEIPGREFAMITHRDRRPSSALVALKGHLRNQPASTASSGATDRPAIATRRRGRRPR
jgi:DNA-binding transcriptional LysR family regulator